jgi:hypothetical protein
VKSAYTFRVLAAHHEFIVDAAVTPGTPGRYSGPPEDCYPADPSEIEVGGISMILGTRKRVIEWDQINEKAQGKILDDIEEQYSELCREWR